MTRRSAVHYVVFRLLNDLPVKPGYSIQAGWEPDLDPEATHPFKPVHEEVTEDILAEAREIIKQNEKVRRYLDSLDMAAA